MTSKRLHIHDVLFPFAFSLPETRETHVLAGTVIPGPATDDCRFALTVEAPEPDCAASYLKSPAAAAAPFRKILPNLRQILFHGYSETVAYHVDGNEHVTETTPLFRYQGETPAFSCVFDVGHLPDFAVTAYETAALYLPKDRFRAFRQPRPDAPLTRIRQRRFTYNSVFTQTHETPWGPVAFSVIPPSTRRNTSDNLSVGGSLKTIKLPDLPLVSPPESPPQTPFRIVAEAWPSPKLLDLLEPQGDAEDHRLSTTLAESALKTYAAFFSYQPDLYIPYRAWAQLKTYEPRLPQPRPFACPWRASTDEGQPARCLPPRPIGKDADAYVVSDLHASEQNLLDRAFSQNNPKARLLFNHPDLEGYDFFDRKPRIAWVRTRPADGHDPWPTLKSDIDAGLDVRIHKRPKALVGITLSKDSPHKVLALDVDAAFCGRPTCYPAHVLFLREGAKPEPHVLIHALEAGYFRPAAEEDLADEETQRQGYQLDLIRDIYARLQGPQAADEELVRHLVKTTLRAYVKAPNLVIALNGNDVNVYFPPETANPQPEDED